MPPPIFSPNQIWQDDCFYLRNGKCERKYYLVLAVSDDSSDALIAAFTTKPNGLTAHPPCSTGIPRAGYYVGVQGGVLPLESWVEFDGLKIVDDFVVKKQIANGQTLLTGQSLPRHTFCCVLRCALNIQDDIEKRAIRWIYTAMQTHGCEQFLR
ncbi:hypothetical protein [Paraburkholderia tropica]|uniref:hypothetical protein n=1 Tax=Paraburkholderia tropica TaxID=92647 RepID=UPI0015919624|nr:hypothetical protein [Paraburkholderia tropica]